MLLLHVAAAHAQDTSRAQALYNEGAVLAEAGNHAAACEKFEAARGLLETVVVQEAMAQCHEKLGKTSTAAGDLDRLAYLLDQRGKTAEATEARARAAVLKKRMPSLVVRVSDADRALVDLKQDGVPFPRTMLGSALPLDPGEHEVEVGGPGRVSRSKKITLADGDHKELVFEPLAAVAPVTSPLPASPSPAAPIEPPPSRLPAYAVLAVAGIGAIVGVSAGIYTATKQSEARDTCPDNACTNPAGVRANESARAAYPVAVVGGAVALVGGAIGGYLLWRPAPSSPEPARTGVYLRPSVGPSAGMISLSGGF